MRRLKLLIPILRSRIHLYLILISIFLSINTSTFAFTGNKEQLIYVESDRQILDFQGNIITFIDNVIVTQKTFKIKADKVIITRSNGKKGKEIIDCYGNPVTFYQLQDNGKFLKGKASEIHYFLVKNYLILNGNAYLEQCDSSIEGDSITYSLQEKQIRAFSKKGKRVTTIIYPSQLHFKKKI